MAFLSGWPCIYIFTWKIYILVIGVELVNNIFVKTIILFLSVLVWCEKQYIGFILRFWWETIYGKYLYCFWIFDCVETIFGERYDFIVLCVMVWLKNNVLTYSYHCFNLVDWWKIIFENKYYMILVLVWMHSFLFTWL